MSQKREHSHEPTPPTTPEASGDPSQNGDYVVRIEKLSVGFESSVVLKEISFDIPRRGVLGILGPAGVGKSTFLRTPGNASLGRAKASSTLRSAKSAPICRISCPNEPAASLYGSVERNTSRMLLKIKRRETESMRQEHAS